MDHCEHCAELLLDYLYELLDEADADLVRTHLDQCAECRAQLAQAEGQQHLIAQAARMYQSVPAFLPPMPSFAQPSSSSETLSLAHETLIETPRVPSRPTPAARPLRLWPWLALAASVLIALGAGWSLYQQGLTTRTDAIDLARQKAKATQHEYAGLKDQYTQQVEALPKQLLSKEWYVEVSGPTVYRQNAENPVYVHTANLNGKQIPSDVTLRLLEPTSGKLLFEKKAEDTTGNVVLNLPPHLAGKAGVKWQLEIEAASIALGGSSKLKPQELVVAPSGYLTQVVASKPVYEIGELLFFRTLTLEQFTLQPPKRSFQLNYALVNAAGTVVKKLTGHSLPDGIGGGEFALTEDIADGAYTLRVEDISPPGVEKYSFAPQSFPVLIHQSQTPKIAFDQQLSPGAKVGYVVQGGINNANQPVTVALKVKDKEQAAQEKKQLEDRPDQLRADEYGNFQGTFLVPKDLSPKAEAELELQVHDGKLNQKFVQTLPVVIPGWEMVFCPEGGQLEANLPNRVYCQVTTPGHKTASLTGELLNSAGKVIATVPLTPHQSKGPAQQLSGSFLLTPGAGDTYKFRVQLTKDAVTEKQLPLAKNGPLALSVLNPVAEEGAPLHLNLQAAKENLPVLVVATCRGQVVAQQLALVQTVGSKLQLPTIAGTHGVIRLTVYLPQAGGLMPLAERLLYRAPAKKLDLSFTAQQNKLNAGQKAGLIVKALDESKKLANSTVLAVVVEESAAHGKETAGTLNLPCYFLLTNSVQEPADLDQTSILLSTGQGSAQALDRFLAIQGWRTFIPAKTGENADKLLVAAPPTDAVSPLLFCRDNLEAVQDGYVKNLAVEMETLHFKLGEQREQVQQKKEVADREHRAALADLQAYETQAREYVVLGATAGLLLILGLGFAFFAVGVWRVIRTLPARNSFVKAFGSLAVCLILLGAASLLHPEDPTAPPSVAQMDLPALGELGQPQKPAGQPLPDLGVLPKEMFSAVDALKETSKKAEDTADNKAKTPATTTSKDSDKGGSSKSKGDSHLGKGGAGEPEKKDGKNGEAQKLAALIQTNTYYLQKNKQDQQAKGLNEGFGGGFGGFNYNNFAKNPRFQGASKLQEQLTKDLNLGTDPKGGSQPTKNPPLTFPGSNPIPSPPAYSNPGGFPPTVPVAPGAGGVGGPSPQMFSPDASNYARQFFYEQGQPGLFHPDTLLWHPNLLLEKGSAVLSFDLPPTSAIYRVFLLAHDDAGRLGFCEGIFEVKANGVKAK